MSVVQLDNGFNIGTQYLFPKSIFPSFIRDKFGRIIGFELNPCSGFTTDYSGNIIEDRPIFNRVGLLETVEFNSNTKLKGVGYDL